MSQTTFYICKDTIFLAEYIHQEKYLLANLQNDINKVHATISDTFFIGSHSQQTFLKLKYNPI